MSQQAIDLEELTRLYDKQHSAESHAERYAAIGDFNKALADAFPALRDELLSHRSIQEAKESGQRTAYEAKRLDHWFNGKRMVYESTCATIEQENSEMRDELVRLRASNAMNEDAANKGDNARQAAGAMESEISRLQDENGKLEKQRNNWKSFADKLQKANISKTRQLDEENRSKETLMQQMGLAKQQIHQAANRLETIRETNPDIALDSDIGQLRVFLKLYEVDKNLIEEGVLRSNLETVAQSMWRTFYADSAPHWKMEPDLAGIALQIDNMYAGLRTRVQTAEHKLDEARTKLGQLQGEEIARQDAEGKLSMVVRMWRESRRKIDEAKGHLETLTKWGSVMWQNRPAAQRFPQNNVAIESARAFLASLAGSCNNQLNYCKECDGAGERAVECDHCKSTGREPEEQPEQYLLDALKSALSDLESSAGLKSTTKGVICHTSISSVRDAIFKAEHSGASLAGSSNQCEICAKPNEPTELCKQCHEDLGGDMLKPEQPTQGEVTYRYFRHRLKDITWRIPHEGDKSCFLAGTKDWQAADGFEAGEFTGKQNEWAEVNKEYAEKNINTPTQAEDSDGKKFQKGDIVRYSNDPIAVVRGYKHDDVIECDTPYGLALYDEECLRLIRHAWEEITDEEVGTTPPPEVEGGEL